MQNVLCIYCIYSVDVVPLIIIISFFIVGTVVNKKPSLVGKDLDLFKLYNLVKENGGMDKVTQELKWRSLYLQMGMPQFSNSSHLIKQAYKK